MALHKSAVPVTDKDILLSLFQAVVKAAEPYVSSWDDLKTLLANGAALAVQEHAQGRGHTLVQAAERLQVDVTTLRRNLPPAPRAEAALARLERAVFRAVDREGLVTMAEIESLLSESSAATQARRSRPRVTIADAVVALVQAGHLERKERSRLPTQYHIAAANNVLQHQGQSREDWLEGISQAVTLAFETAIQQSRTVTSGSFARAMDRARAQGAPMPVPEGARMPWFFAQRPSDLSPHALNERFTAAIRDVIAALDAERAPDDRGEPVRLCLTLNHDAIDEAEASNETPTPAKEHPASVTAERAEPGTRQERAASKNPDKPDKSGEM